MLERVFLALIADCESTISIFLYIFALLQLLLFLFNLTIKFSKVNNTIVDFVQQYLSHTYSIPYRLRKPIVESIDFPLEAG
jgi:hypothetical protein